MKCLQYALSLCLLFSSFDGMAQYILNEADKQYESFEYAKAIDLYEQAYKKKATLHAAERLANCYRFNNNYKQAESWYAIAIAFPDSKPENILHYAQALQNNSKYAEAKVQYLNYPAADKAQQTIWAASCDSAIEWMKHPATIQMDNFGVLNSPKSDWGAVDYEHGIVFTSDRFTGNTVHTKAGRGLLRFDTRIDPNEKQYGWTGNDYLHLFFKPGNEDTVHLFPLKTGTNFHVGPVTFTKDGTEMYYSLTRIPGKIHKTQGKSATVNIEIYSSKKDASGNWSSPRPFQYNNVNEYSVSDPFISPDGNTLYFSSNMQGGKGGTDIYVSFRTAANEWSQPVNVEAVNTAGDERSPSFDRNHNFYFSSNGRIGMGGLDVFRIPRDQYGKISGQPQNMGYPFNSPQDDFSFHPTDEGVAYLSSNREGGSGSDDIYKLYQHPVPPTPVDITVIDEKTKEPLANGIISLEKVGSPALKTQTDEHGKVQLGLDRDTSYRIVVEKSDYHVNEVKVPKGDSATKEIPMAKIEMNKEIVLPNIYFDFDSYNIRPDAHVALDKLVKLMKDDVTLWIVLGSHTDSRGNDAYNLKLSQNRANAVVNYLILKGISKNRVEAKGYGETMLLNKCANGVNCTPAEHQVNRRTEFKIVKK